MCAALIADTCVEPGIDVEYVENRNKVFVEDYFSSDEQKLVKDNNLLITAVWSLKEAVVKSQGVGLRLNPRQIQVQAIPKVVQARSNTIEPFKCLFAPRLIDVLVVGKPIRVLAGIALLNQAGFVISGVIASGPWLLNEV